MFGELVELSKESIGRNGLRIVGKAMVFFYVRRIYNFINCRWVGVLLFRLDCRLGLGEEV